MISYKEPIKDAPCKSACPAGINIPRYARLISQKMFDDALAIIYEKNPFPSICGHVCYRPCEEVCQAHHMSGSIKINSLKLFVAEHAFPPPC